MAVAAAAMEKAMRPLILRPSLADLCFYNLDLHTGNRLEQLRSYFSVCSKSNHLFVTTSCFAAWKKEKCTNGSAKLIPAVPADAIVNEGKEPCCVFFFDDNINLHLSSAGAPGTKGICNLRDINTGDYIDFTEGKNGFVCERAYRHTLIHHSSVYRNVLVKVNILEAMTHEDYFTSIIAKYSRPSDKVIIYMDVNGTILWSDSIMGLGPTELVLEAMAGLTDVRPKGEAFDVEWRDYPALRIEKSLELKTLMSQMCQDNKQVFASHLQLEDIMSILRLLSRNAEFAWGEQEATFGPEEFRSAFDAYMVELRKQERGEVGKSAGGITLSWFRCLRECVAAGHAVVINSFGMDTQAVVRRSLPDKAKDIMHVAVNFEMWSERDTTKFASQFQEEERIIAALASSRSTAFPPDAERDSSKPPPPPSPPPPLFQERQSQGSGQPNAASSSSAPGKAAKGHDASAPPERSLCPVSAAGGSLLGVASALSHS